MIEFAEEEHEIVTPMMNTELWTEVLTEIYGQSEAIRMINARNKKDLIGLRQQQLDEFLEGK
jgi:hypothetical protein